MIEADLLDDSATDESDVISTDRQDIEWENNATKPLMEWGAALTRKALRECADVKGGEMRDWILQDPAIASRVERLDASSKKQVKRFLTILGPAEPDHARALELGDGIIRAFEYRHFHDFVSHLEEASEDPDKLHELATRLKDWKVLESRAVLEIVRGRLGIIDKFYGMILANSPETASSKSKTNFHDLIGGYPWLLNPKWQVFEEEKQISTKLAEFGEKDIPEEAERSRYDFLALTDRRTLVIVELKRPAYAVTAEELLRLIRYRELLARGTTLPIDLLLVHGGTVDASREMLEEWSTERQQLISWADVYSRCKAYYEHYRAILEGDASSLDFTRKVNEALHTRAHLGSDTIHRPPALRKEGLGPQDVSHVTGPPLAYWRSAH